MSSPFAEGEPVSYNAENIDMVQVEHMNGGYSRGM